MAVVITIPPQFDYRQNSARGEPPNAQLNIAIQTADGMQKRMTNSGTRAIKPYRPR
jgi:hypothetical protein